MRRRLRRTAAIRRLVADTSVTVDDLVAPVFVREGSTSLHRFRRCPVWSSTRLIRSSSRRSVSFNSESPPSSCSASPRKKTHRGAAPRIRTASRSGRCALRDAIGDELALIADLCLDEYTDHGHCGLLDAKGIVDNDATLERYSEVALAQAAAGADIVAPSGMMDGQVRAIRSALDESGHSDVAVLAYAAKYASAMYGPFRDAVNVAIADGGDRRSYQQDPARSCEGIAEAMLDVAEGADVVMVKPALHYLDVLSDVARAVDVPVAAYHVSGEYRDARVGRATRRHRPRRGDQRDAGFDQACRSRLHPSPT